MPPADTFGSPNLSKTIRALLKGVLGLTTVILLSFDYPASSLTSVMSWFSALGIFLCLLSFWALYRKWKSLARVLSSLLLVGCFVGLLGADLVSTLGRDHGLGSDVINHGRQLSEYAQMLGFLVAGICLILLSEPDASPKPSVNYLLPAFFGFMLFLLGLLIAFGYLLSPNLALNPSTLHGATVCIFLGGALLGLVWRKVSLAVVLKSVWLPLSLASGILMVSIGLWRTLTYRDHLNFSQTISTELEETTSEIQRRMELRSEALGRLANHWSRWGRPARSVWETDAFDYVNGHQGYQSLGWADPEYHLRWIVPIKGNEACLNLDLSFEPRRRQALEAARKSKRATLTRPLDLVEGGKGFRIIYPIFIKDRFDGFLVTAFKYQYFLNLILPPHIARGYFISIYDHGESIYERPLSADNEASLEWMQRAKVNLLDSAWEVRVWPTPAKVIEETSWLPTGILTIGTLFAGLTGLIVYHLQMAWRRKEEGLAAQRLELELVERDASEKRLRALLEAAPDAMLIFNHQNVIVSVNSQAEHLLGQQRHHLVGRPVEQFLTQRYRSDNFCRIAIESNEQVLTTHPDTYLQRSDGSSFPAQVSCSFVELGSEKLGIAAIRDVTFRKQQEEELARSNLELEHFAYVASHDLQEPLRMIVSYLELLSKRYSGKLDQDADDFIAFAIDGAHRMRQLIDDLLSLSRVSRSKVNREGLVSLEDALNRAIANLRVRIAESGAQITHSNLPVIRGDSVQFVQLFQNLIANAIKYRKSSPPDIHISAERKNQEWVIRISDNGIGFEMKYSERIFVVFQRLHTRQEYSGNGVGLAICKRIAERHGGKIWAESEVGEGSTFFISLPVENEVMVS